MRGTGGFGGVAWRLAAAAAAALSLASCGNVSSKVDPKYGVAASPRVVEPGQPVPKGGGRHSVGKPYTIAGRTYVPETDPEYSAEGIASWYGDDFHGRKTANGEIFDMHSIAAAHPTLPLPSYVRVTNLRNKRSLIVRVNDRGPYHGNRIIDLSVRAAKMLDFHRNGVARVRVDYVGRASLRGADDEKLAMTLRNGTPAPSPSETMVASAEPRQSAPRVQLASSGPFRPEYFDPNAMSRGGIPTPQERPFDLGEGRPADHASAARGVRPAAPDRAPQRRAAAAPQLASAASVPVTAPAPRVSQADGPATFQARFGNVSAAPLPALDNGPAQAYAPRRGHDTLSTGRGLY